MTAPVFVDANVLLYSRDPLEPAKMSQARAWLDHLWRQSLGCTSMQVLSEFYVNLKRKAGAGLAPDEAWREVSKYLAWRPQAIDEDLFRRAHEIERRHRLSWWDSMVVAAAQVQHCVLLLTEDLQDGAVLGSVTVRSPFTLAVQEAAAAYTAPRAAPRYRSRGRPRRAA